MTNDFESIQSIADAAIGAIGDELTFAFSRVLEVIALCTTNEIAVLGVEIFEVRSGGYSTVNLSTYEQQMGSDPKQRSDWADYVKANNVLADEFIRSNPTGDEHVYLLTTASWGEFCKIQEVRGQ